MVTEIEARYTERMKTLKNGLAARESDLSARMSRMSVGERRAAPESRRDPVTSSKRPKSPSPPPSYLDAAADDSQPLIDLGEGDGKAGASIPGAFDGQEALGRPTDGLEALARPTDHEELRLAASDERPNGQAGPQLNRRPRQHLDLHPIGQPGSQPYRQQSSRDLFGERGRGSAGRTRGQNGTFRRRGRRPERERAYAMNTIQREPRGGFDERERGQNGRGGEERRGGNFGRSELAGSRAKPISGYISEAKAQVNAPSSPAAPVDVRQYDRSSTDQDTSGGFQPQRRAPSAVAEASPEACKGTDSAKEAIETGVNGKQKGDPSIERRGCSGCGSGLRRTRTRGEIFQLVCGYGCSFPLSVIDYADFRSLFAFSMSRVKACNLLPV